MLDDGVLCPKLIRAPNPKCHQEILRSMKSNPNLKKLGTLNSHSFLPIQNKRPETFVALRVLRMPFFHARIKRFTLTSSIVSSHMTSLLHTQVVLNRITDIIQPFQDYTWVYIFLAAGALRFWRPSGFHLKKLSMDWRSWSEGISRKRPLGGNLLEETSWRKPLGRRPLLSRQHYNI